MRKITIGGEFYYKPSIIFKKKKFDLIQYLNKKYPNKQYTFTGGGYYSLYSIIEDIGFNKFDEILLPSYLCPTILTPFKKKNIEFRFFNINENLTIDIEDLKNDINKKTRAVLFINYFGFPPDEKTKIFLNELKDKNIIIIEDCVQSFFSDIELIGDYAFNSFKKFLPVDGSVIISANPMKSISKSKSFTKYFFLKAIGQFLRLITISNSVCDFSRIFLKLFSLANEDYYKHIKVSFNWWNKLILSKYDIGLIIEQRFNNFINLLEEYKNIAVIKDIKKNIVPLGFPILLKNRDEIRNDLISNNVFCPIHWKLSKEINKTKYNESWELSNNIITLPINENILSCELQYLKQNMEEYYEDLS